VTTKYKVSGYSYDDKIEAFEVIRETAAQVVFIDPGWSGKLSERREHKVSDYHRWFDSEAAAAQFLIGYRTKQMEDAKRNYENARSRLGDTRAKYRHLVDAQETPEAK
jgi:hypothetical protein